jgi:hypothetical protein
MNKYLYYWTWNLFIILLLYVWMKRPRHTYGGFVPAISERGMTSYLPLQIRFWTKFRHDLPRNFVYEECRQRTQLSAGYSYDLFWHTVWLLRHFEVRFYFWADSGPIGTHVFDMVFRPQWGWNLLGLNKQTGGNQLSFLSPTQTHGFDNRCNGYGCLSTAHVRSSGGR